MKKRKQKEQINIGPRHEHSKLFSNRSSPPPPHYYPNPIYPTANGSK
jgi:hypothetical protein